MKGDLSLGLTVVCFIKGALFGCKGSLVGCQIMGHRQKKKIPSSVLLLLWPGEVRRKREGDSGQTGPALFAGSNKTELGNFFFLPMPHIA